MTRRKIIKEICCPLLGRKRYMRECFNCPEYQAHDLDLDEWLDCKGVKPRK